MEYNSESNENLGKSTGIEGVYLSSLKTNEYNSDKKKPAYVVFQPNGDSYNALADYDIGYDISNTPFSERKNRPNANEDCSSETGSDDGSEKKTKNIFHIGPNPINQFFIGSVTVVGLFILYRFLHKNK